MVRQACSRAAGVRHAAESPSTPKVTKSRTAQRKEDRADANFVKVMRHTFKDDHMSDLQYVHHEIDEHDEWVPWLASLFRSGRMARLVEQAAAGDDDDDDEVQMGKRIPTRIRKLAKLPKLDLYHLLNALRGDLPPIEQVDFVHLLAALQYILHFDSETPMPEDEAAWRLVPLTMMCVRRDKDVGSRLKGVDFTNGIPKDCWLFWALTDVACVQYRPTEEVVELPCADEADGWTLDAPATVRCTATSVKKKGWRISLVDELQEQPPDMTSAWTYKWEDLKKEAEETTVSSSSSEVGGAKRAGGPVEEPVPKKRVTTKRAGLLSPAFVRSVGKK